ncbi:MAG: YeeE/YedE family protein, partial [Nitrospirota bacterium]
MERSKLVLISALLVAVLAVVPLGLSVAFAQETGGGSTAGYGQAPGYGGSTGGQAESSGYGGAAAKTEASGYGGSSGSQAQTSGYGGAAAKTETSGYGGGAPAAGGAGAQATTPGYKTGGAAPIESTKELAKPVRNKMDFGFIASGLLVGILLGWVLQRGRFCMNTAFRDTIFIKDMTLLRAYAIALMVTIVGAHLLNDLGFLHLKRQPFLPVAQIVGGYVFGLGIVLAGGCGSGIWYRAGEGQIASFVAIMGFFAGIVTTVDGLLKPLNSWMMSISVPVNGQRFPGLWQLLPLEDSLAVKWGVIAVLVVAGFIFIQKDKPFSLGKQKGYYWSLTGLLVGLIAVLAFWTSEYFGGFARGLSFTTPTRELFYTVFNGEPHSRFFPVRELGFVKTTWGVFFILGVPIGSYLSARGFQEFSWKVPPAKELLVVFGGSLMMGFGASTALGCNMGQGITG